MDIQNLKSFLTLFLPYLDRTRDRAALRFLHRHVKFSLILSRSIIISKDFIGPSIPIAVVMEGLINYRIINDDRQQNDPWIGVKGSVIIPPPIDFQNSRCGELVVEAFQDAKIIFIDATRLEEGIQLYPQLNSILFRFIFPKAIYDVNQRNIFFRLPKLSSRIKYFQQLFPGVMELLPAELVESYLYINSFDEYSEM
nr:hypothetical protein [Pedobacter sp. ASV2]